MIISNVKSANAAIGLRFRQLFRTRDFLIHDGRRVRRFSVRGGTQAMAAGTAVCTLALSAYGAAHAGGMVMGATDTARIERMQGQVAEMQADVARLHDTARAHAARVEQRQALLAAVLTGAGDPEALATATLGADATPGEHAAIVTTPFATVERRQVAFAEQARAAAEARFARTAGKLKRMGLRPERLVGAMGGPLEPVEAAATGGAQIASADANADAQFRALFMSWKKLDTLEQAAIAIPSLQPVANLTLTSSFGVRSDPFRGTAAMHAGIDIPGPIGTPIYATADGIVARSERAGGYGNLVAINHGKGIETRYGHLSKLLVEANTRVRRGQLIGLMGSTGRSTGSHLHYEVRIDGAAVNPMPYMQAGDVALAAYDRAARQPVSVGGPRS